MQNFLGQLTLAAFNFAPKGWAFCAGQLLPVQQNQALYSLLGTQFGGNGTSTFALPDLRGRVAIGFSAAYPQGLVAGSETVSLTGPQTPAHSHLLTVSNALNPAGTSVAGSTVGTYSGPAPYAAMANGFMATNSLSLAGSSQPHENRAPYLGLNWIIALTGIFPSRN